VAGEQLEQLIGRGFAIKRLDRPGDLLGVRNHLLLGDICRSLVLVGERAGHLAHPENVADPKITFRRLRRGKLSRHGAARRVRRGGETGKRQQQ
jgi:hypothetical protein